MYNKFHNNINGAEHREIQLINATLRDGLCIACIVQVRFILLVKKCDYIVFSRREHAEIKIDIISDKNCLQIPYGEPSHPFSFLHEK